ncbi:aldo/keto reductase family oxidoreductase [Corallincola platygyrae]|uniref:Aldo/keto reductase family oxidoreductase n=1 Tax=Corallincola platygyrae TaxID=1193278 RepID=A0ABW4XM14_9GAMM
MKTLPIQNHLPEVSRLIFGCMGLGGSWDNQPYSGQDLELAHRSVDVALDCGINFFDHADIYTLGKAEQVFGEVLKSRPGLRENIILQSKCGIRFEDDHGPKRYDLSPEWITQSVDNILSRLQTEYLDIMLLHRPDPLMEPGLIAEAFEKLQRSGKVRHFGVSNMNQHQIELLQSEIEQPLIVNQLPLSLSQNAFVEDGVLVGTGDSANVGYTPGLTEYCQRNAVQLQSWGSLAQGLFSGRDVSDQPGHIQATANLVREMAHGYQTSAEAIVLAWLMNHPAAIQPVLGTTHEGRLRACAMATEVNLSREDWYKLYVSARGNELP